MPLTLPSVAGSALVAQLSQGPVGGGVRAAAGQRHRDHHHLAVAEQRGGDRLAQQRARRGPPLQGRDGVPHRGAGEVVAGDDDLGG